MNAAELKIAVSSPADIKKNPFGIARELCSLYGAHANEGITQDLVLRALEQRSHFGKSSGILDALVRELGLFPYLNPRVMTAGDQVAYEMHRSMASTSQIVFHVRQNAVFQALLRKKNVILSAPPSFGKSVLIDALIMEEIHDNILIVVPTIALIDETRRRLAAKVRGRYKIVTHHSQVPSQKNVFIFTQERVLEQPHLESVNLLIIDEFYKLTPSPGDEERWARLNEVLYRYWKKVDQIYLLGPNVGAIEPTLLRALEPEVFDEDYRTVAAEIHDETNHPAPLGRLVEICARLSDPTIIFCSSPDKAMLVAKQLIAGGIQRSSPQSRLAADWVAKTFHPEWHFATALRNGIGVHHGRIPRSLAQFLIRAFDEGEIKFLVCTSTLIEGVNTRARNMIIFDHTIDGRNIDRFTFNNIKGRSGRMGRYYVGHVFLFHDPPQDALPRVDVPAFSQSESAPDSLLMQLEDYQLTDASRERLEKYRHQKLLPYELLQANGIDPERQLQVAADLSKNIDEYSKRLQWKAVPVWDELLLTCQLIWQHFEGRRKGGHSVTSPLQLAYFLHKLKWSPVTSEWIQSQFLYWKDADKAVTKVLDFYRLWAGVHFPRLLRVFDKIQRHVLASAGRDTGNYELFATRVQNLFLPPFITDLDEYGIPIEIGRRLARYLGENESLDQVLEKIRRLDLSRTRLDDFEKRLIELSRREM
ncbi:MAG TPA: DEAD/DEAH box helicase [Terriglobales bacterium]|jgi:superfamily II DNA/RNA helicase|nr:DEAD/DEAH box helicase [Terriglobales bacterium]